MAVEGQVSRAKRCLDVLAASVAAKLNCKNCLISVREEDALYAMGHSDAPSKDENRWVAARDTICQYTARLGKPAKINEVDRSPMLRDAPTVSAFGIGAYLGAPLVLHDGSCIGAMCALSTTPRVWTDDELAFLLDAAQMASDQIELQVAKLENTRLSGALGDVDRIVATLAQSRRGARSVHDERGQIIFANQAMYAELGLGPHDLDELPHALLGKSEGLDDGSDFMLQLDLGERGHRWLRVRCNDGGSGLTLCDWELARQPVDAAGG